MTCDPVPGQAAWPAGPAQRGARPAPTRRTVLLMAGGLAGAVIGSAPQVAAAAPGRGARGQVPPGPGPGWPGMSRPREGLAFGGPGAADWHALRNALSTRRLLRPGQAGYSRARLLFDPRFDHQRPAGVAYCAGPADVAACLDFVRRFALPVAARSGGHSYAGWSGGAGLTVDVSEMDWFRPGPGAGEVTVGAGIRLIDFYDQLSRLGLAVPGGSCPTVGIAGLTLGGGVGVVSRAYGLTSDNLQAVQVVTADGSVLDADAAHHPDLFWACRGGGGGNFGVATSFTFRTRRLSRLALFFLSWPWAQAHRVVDAWQHWAPHAPDALWSNLHLSAAAGGPAPSLQVGGAYLGETAGAQRCLDQLYAAVGTSPSSVYLSASSYLDAMMADAGCAGLSTPECHLPWQAPGGRLSREPSFAKSDFFTRPLPAAGIDLLLRGVERFPNAAGGSGGIAFDAFGGALNRVPAETTAFSHRDALFLAQYTTVWRPGAPPFQLASQRAWLRSCYASMRGHASGQCYQNYIDPDLPDWRSAYYGPNYPRLALVKAAYDPQQVFRFPQGVTPAC